MSKKTSSAFPSALPALLVAAVLCGLVYGADPNAPSKGFSQAKHLEPNAPAGKEKIDVPTTALSASRPPRPVRRSPASFTPEMSFSDAIDILRNCTTPPLNIVVLWREIEENARVYRDTPIGIDGVPGLRVGQYLDLLVLSLSAGGSAKLGYAVQHGAIIIATTDSLPAPRKVTRVYDISDLVAEPARYFFPPLMFGGMGYGSPMMGPPGGYGGGYAPGASYPFGGPYGFNGVTGLSGFVSPLSPNTAAGPTPRR